MKSMFRLCSLTVLLALPSCGGGSGNEEFDLNAIVGEYLVEVEQTADSGNCAFASFSIEQALNGTTALSQTGEGRVEIRLPALTILEGDVFGDTLEASGLFPLGGMGAGVVETTWTRTGDRTFDVEYRYSEGFVGQTSDCSQQFTGEARAR